MRETTPSANSVRIVVIGSPEQRRRYRFVTEPLAAGGHDVRMVMLSPVGSFLRAMARLATRRDPADVLIMIGLGPKGLFAVAAARWAGIPVLARLGGDPLRDAEVHARAARAQGRWAAWLRERINLMTRRWLLHRADGLIVVNASMVAPLEARLGHVPISVVPQFSPGAEHPRDHALAMPVRLLTVTNLAYPAKAEGVLWLVDHLAEIAASGGPAMDFAVAGGGPHLEELRRALGERALPGGLSVRVLGFVDDVEALYREANLFLYHSLHDATPNVILESKRFALPLMANACEEFANIVDDGLSGMLYADAAGFRAGLERLLADESLRQRLGSGALADHRSRFSVAAATRGLEQALSRTGILPTAPRQRTSP